MLRKILPILFLALWVGIVQAQDIGFFTRADCDADLTPVNDQTVCMQTTDTSGGGGRVEGVYRYTGSAWVTLSSGGGSFSETDITGQTADTTPSTDDLAVTVNDPGGTPALRKVTLSNLTKGLDPTTAPTWNQDSSGTSAFATALATNPTDCLVQGAYADTIDASGNLTCDILVVTSASAPTVNDDTGDGYIVGTKWIETTTGSIYQAVDVTGAAAVWRKMCDEATNCSPTGTIDLSGATVVGVVTTEADTIGTTAARGRADFGADSSANEFKIGSASDKYIGIYYDATTGAHVECNTPAGRNKCNHGADLEQGYSFTIRDHNKAVIAQIDEDRTLHGPAFAKTVQLRASGAISTGDGKDYFFVPPELDGWVLTTANVKGNLVTVSSSGLPQFDLAQCAVVATGSTCSGTVTDVLSTNGTFDANTNDTDNATTPLVVTGGSVTVHSGEAIRLDIDAAGTGAADMHVTLTFTNP